MNPIAPNIILAIVGILTFTATVATISTKLFLSKLTDVREITGRDLKAVEHKANNTALRVDALEKKSEEKEIRLVRLELLFENVSKMLERIEAKIDRQQP